MIKLKSFTKKFPELKNNTMQSSYRWRADGNRRENSGNKPGKRIEENTNNLRKN